MSLHPDELAELERKKPYASVAEALYDSGVEEEKLKALENNTSLAVDLGLDETKYQTLYSNLESLLGIKIDPDAYHNTVGELVDYIAPKEFCEYFAEHTQEGIGDNGVFLYDGGKTACENFNCQYGNLTGKYKHEGDDPFFGICRSDGHKVYSEDAN